MGGSHEGAHIDRVVGAAAAIATHQQRPTLVATQDAKDRRFEVKARQALMHLTQHAAARKSLDGQNLHPR
jgi:hypothetical protein